MYKDFGELCRTCGCDAILITDPYNMRYLSDFSGGEGMLFLSEERGALITDSRYTEAAGRESGLDVIEENRDNKRADILAQLLRETGAVRVGYEDRHLTCAAFAELGKKLPAVGTWIPVGEKVEALRAVKREDEIEKIARAEALGDAAFAELLPMLRAGMTEREAAAQLEFIMKKRGADGLSFETIMASGPHTSMPHAVPTDRAFAPGDLITMDFGCIVEGYCSDMTRTVAIGDASGRQREVYDVVLRAQTAAIDAIRPGMTGREADAIARDIIRDAGYGAYFGHALGHSLGLYIHEDPRLSPACDAVLTPGMVVTVEPGIYLPGEFGVRIEDVVVITEEGCSDLTHSPKEALICAGCS